VEDRTPAGTLFHLCQNSLQGKSLRQAGRQHREGHGNIQKVLCGEGSDRLGGRFFWKTRTGRCKGAGLLSCFEFSKLTFRKIPKQRIVSHHLLCVPRKVSMRINEQTDNP
jgi:hypothetical protein